jgi:hypothetical protein
MRKTAIVSLLALAAAAPAFAGTVYIPAARNIQDGTKNVATEVWLSNTSASAITAELLFLENGKDGTDRDKAAAAEEKVQIPAKRTVVLTAAALGKRGMLEISGPSALVVNSRLVTTIEDPAGAAGSKAATKSLGAFLPTVGSENVAFPDTTLYLQGLERSEARTSDLIIVNLGHANAQCEVSFVRTGGAQIGNKALLTVKALSHNEYVDALGTLGETAVKDVRAQVSCKQSFFAYAVIREDGDVAVLTASGTGNSSLTKPGFEEPAPEGAVTLNVNGVFHRPTRQVPFKRYDIYSAAAVTYKELIVELDVTVGPFHNNNGGNAHNLFQVIRHPRWRDNVMFYGNAWSNGVIKNTTNYDNQNHIRRSETNLKLANGETYHFRLYWNHGARQRQVQISQGGSVIRTISDSFTGPLRFGGTKALDDPGIMIAFGHTGHEHAGEERTEGWDYSNLKVRLIP